MPGNPVIVVTGTCEGLGYGTARLLATGTAIVHARPTTRLVRRHE
ncbi:hypothetical protein QRX60_30530 [Amycolatopsis mongoliensis]|uniref:Uncharacterized protein n=1 Tax=Amycolatopsis mongoliensis TaxID=715475 RepID=A0A9Y2JH61_9PSEU|nr:hypothetical protein [Amycolatopsis sp. 4-36]WIX98392.1 hypothetical protein QRX60_30530 [Amycolatopsis sp. 4-36]